MDCRIKSGNDKVKEYPPCSSGVASTRRGIYKATVPSGAGEIQVGGKAIS
jgi:hypothetical protein